MDRSWMHITDRLKSREYAKGVKDFITFARSHAIGCDKIRCPCRLCSNNYWLPISMIERHLFIKGIDPNYTAWIFHGDEEALSVSDDYDLQESELGDEYIDDIDVMLEDIRAGKFGNVASTESFHARVSTPVKTRKRGRGLGKSTSFDQLRKHGKISLKIKDGETAPCCEKCTMFTTRVTWILKHHADLSHPNWHDVPNHEKDKLVTRVRADFILDWSKKNHRSTVMKTLWKRFNAIRYDLHKIYMQYNTHEEALANGTEMVNPQRGRSYVQDGQARASRQKQQTNHTAGRTSFVRLLEIRYETEPNLIDFFKDVRWSKKKGKFVTPMTEEHYNLMVAKLDQLEPENRTKEAAAEIFREVLGHRPGYVRGLGEMVMPKSSKDNTEEWITKLAAAAEKHEKDTQYYKSLLDELRGDVRVLLEKQAKYDNFFSTYMSKRQSHGESHREADQGAA
ncbi:hypothetical protein F2P56_007617 [Juglans regia]|nr:uncharacterized protein LOC109008644 isoform X2 [Juglans regia]XP_035544897.1 uncharacterized protein LOC109008644 isoform X2 [Juglans regia]KAF5475855.1 hypothetical protein F2P56_007617 [Juglans regia]